MPMKISGILRSLEPSATLAMSAKAKELKASGRKVLDLSVGEPDFPTPWHICEAAFQAMKAGNTRYTVASGIPELKQAVVADYQRRYGLKYTPDQVVISNGAKHAIHNALTAVLDPGDEVIIPAPYWVSYAELVKLTGARPVIVPTDEQNCFKITPEQLRAAITPRTQLLLLCSPSNPTGATYSREELEKLANIVVEHDLMVLSDEVYDQLVYDGFPYASFPTVQPGLVDRTIVINAVSKTYAMTGWRIGWSISPAPVARAIGDLQSQETSNPCSISQYAALAALQGPQECVGQMRAEFARRRDYVTQRLNAIPQIRCPHITGAFYAFVNISPYLGKTYNGKVITNTEEWCLEFLSQHGVALVMGSAFGAEGYVRLSFAASLETLEEALNRLEEFLLGAK